MKTILFFSMLTLVIGCSPYYTKHSSFNDISPRREKTEIVDAWIKKFELGKMDSLVIRTKFIPHKVVAIPYSETIKFEVRNAEGPVIFLESKASNKKISFNVDTSWWGWLKTIQ